MKFLEKDLIDAKVVSLENYDFKVYSFGEKSTFFDYKLIDEVKSEFEKLSFDFEIDSIVSTEPGGNMWGFLMSLILKKPLKIVRISRDFEIKGVEKFVQKNKYCNRELCFPEFDLGEKVLIVEDVISSGKTVELMLDVFEGKGVEVVGIVAILRKMKDDLDKYGILIKTILEDS